MTRGHIAGTATPPPEPAAALAILDPFDVNDRSDRLA